MRKERKMNQQETWIATEKQIGKGVFYLKDGQRYWQEVAVQQFNGKYYAYFCDIPEDKMMLHPSAKNQFLERFLSLSEAFDHLRHLSFIPIEELVPFDDKLAFELTLVD